MGDADKRFQGRHSGALPEVKVFRGTSMWTLKSPKKQSIVYRWGGVGDPEPLAISLLASSFGEEDTVCYLCDAKGHVRWDDAEEDWVPTNASASDSRDCPDCEGTGLNPMIRRLIPEFVKVIEAFDDNWEITQSEIMMWAAGQVTHRAS